MDAILDRRGEPARRQRARGWHAQVTRLEVHGERSVERMVDPVLPSWLQPPLESLKATARDRFTALVDRVLHH